MSCSICFCDLIGDKEVVKTRCLHDFHYDCLAEWLDVNNNCPICRCNQPNPEICANKPDPNLYILNPISGEYVERFSRLGYSLARQERINNNIRLRLLRTAGTRVTGMGGVTGTIQM